MNLITKAPRGTQDILPEDSFKWRFLENIMMNQAKIYGFSEIRTPAFEHTELFLRSVGEKTDVVQKEMYTFLDKGKRSLTLRPEGTAGVARAILEHGLFNDALPIKLSYLTSCYRYEKPQSGRFREFRQFGVEMFGSEGPSSDAEVISLASSIFDRIGIKDIIVEINSIGCKHCRKNYYAALKEYFNENINLLCETCKERFSQNPMRILDCKNPECKKITQNAPSVLDFICDDCKDHFNKVKNYLDKSNIDYIVNPKIVRGLDYYTRTVFEFVSQNESTKGLVCGGGGRYNGLIEELGGNYLPALGFGLGMERILLAMEKQNIEIDDDNQCDIYIASVGDLALEKSMILTKLLRESSIKAEFDTLNRSLKAQMKYAGKVKAKFTMVLGEDEINASKAKVKNMSTGEFSEVSLNENFLNDFFKVYLDSESKNLLNR